MISKKLILILTTKKNKLFILPVTTAAIGMKTAGKETAILIFAGGD